MSAATGVRARTFSWEDPAALARAGAQLPGLEHLRRIADGTLPKPPVAAMMGFEIVELDPGRAVFAMEPGEWLYNPIGSVHGGVVATLLDSCMGCAVHTLLDAGVGYTTTDLQVRYLRPLVEASGRVLAEGTVVHAGRRLATAEGRVWAEAEPERLLAHGSTGVAILR
jgi:uncharacterized protein (TIGR00369 family)